ncbi:MAG: hypothetical protein NTV56_03015 [Alphaproteobacteria bacterium]|nr:hypothetical protein [Alphaproteobacteria bacterium]
MTDHPSELMQKFTSDAAAGQVNIQPKDASTLILLDLSALSYSPAAASTPPTGR